MEGQEKVRSINQGVSLIEVMVSLIILSVFIGLSSRFISSGSNQPYIAGGIEQWMNFVETSSNRVLYESDVSEVTKLSISSSQFEGLEMPLNLKYWNLDWEDCNISDTSVAKFSATTSNGKYISWLVFRESKLP